MKLHHRLSGSHDSHLGSLRQLVVTILGVHAAHFPHLHHTYIHKHIHTQTQFSMESNHTREWSRMTWRRISSSAGAGGAWCSSKYAFSFFLVSGIAFMALQPAGNQRCQSTTEYNVRNVRKKSYSTTEISH